MNKQNKTKNKHVSIIVLNFRQADLTIGCIKSLLKQTYTKNDILVIDNDSGDGSYEKINSVFKSSSKVKVYQTGKNLGYAGGNNFGVKKAKGEYIAILNNDTVVKKDWLEWLVKGLESEDNVKVVGAEMPIVGRDNQVPDYKKRFVTKTLTGYSVFVDRKKTISDITFVDQFSAGGCAFIYDRKIIDLPFPDEYFIYAEDTYFNWVVQLMGYKVIKATKSYGDHFHNMVRKTASSSLNYYMIYLAERNIYLNLLTLYELKNVFRVFPLMLLKILLRNIYEPRKIPAHLKSYLWILFHPNYIYSKRKMINKLRRVSDSKIVSMLSYKIYDESKMSSSGFALRLANKIAYYYCKLVGLRTVEFL